MLVIKGGAANALPNTRALFAKYASDTRAIREAGELVQAGINPPVATGELKASIALHQEGGTVRIEAGAPHAKYVEFGTKFMGPRPFLRTAFNSRREAAIEKYTKVLMRHKR